MSCSLVMATYNRSRLLEQSLGRLTTWRTAPDEIVVVDDGGTDDTKDVCEAYGVRYLYNNHPGETLRCHAMNVALKQALYDEILVSDAEILFESNVVHQLLEARAQKPAVVLTAEGVYRDGKLGPGGNVSLYKREWLEEIGGWDEAMPAPTGYDDYDLHTRLTLNGHPQVAVDGVLASHQPHRILPMNQEGWPYPSPNQEYMARKEFPRDLVANQGKAWGKLCLRSEEPRIDATCGGGGCGCLSR